MPDTYSSLSKKMHFCLMKGDYVLLICYLKRMADILEMEKNYLDMLKVLLFIYYVKLGYLGDIDICLIERINNCIKTGEIDLCEVYEIYTDIAFEKPKDFYYFENEYGFDLLINCLVRDIITVKQMLGNIVNDANNDVQLS